MKKNTLVKMDSKSTIIVRNQVKSSRVDRESYENSKKNLKE